MPLQLVVFYTHYFLLVFKNNHINVYSAVVIIAESSFDDGRITTSSKYFEQANRLTDHRTVHEI